ncbi:hypothetical protein EVAR_83334_1 [Eumeta japonica]|uniref:Uncharacterized protein n=1 Tax=Eumeta variegata TaxID=151549 RepID=A0A4C1VYC6_EUMVA|nr:hypothetical protein EVAR_83334_1 [Eumeta japonica]
MSIRCLQNPEQAPAPQTMQDIICFALRLFRYTEDRNAERRRGAARGECTRAFTRLISLPYFLNDKHRDLADAVSRMTNTISASDHCPLTDNERKEVVTCARAWLLRRVTYYAAASRRVSRDARAPARDGTADGIACRRGESVRRTNPVFGPLNTYAAYAGAHTVRVKRIITPSAHAHRVSCVVSARDTRVLIK